MRVLVVTNMYPTEDKPAFGTFVRDQVESLRALGVDVDVFFMDGKASRLNYARGFGDLQRHLCRHAPYDLIHAHYVFSGLVALSQRRLPVVLTHHGIEVVLGWQGHLCRWVTPRVDAVIVTSGVVKRALGDEDAVVIPCGVDMARFAPMPQAEARARLGLPADGKLVLFAGEPRPEKRLEVIQAAVALLAAQDSGVRLVVASNRPHEEMPLYMNACDALALASDFEGSPMVIKEAMACNLPIVSVDVGDVAEIIGDTDGCYLCERTPEDMAAKLRLALARGNRTDGRRRVMHLSLEATAKRILAVYEGVLATRGEPQIG
ncbi:MAG: glycosyltransferase [Anaerolineae bacterium]|nr:glycosyltransferase [Anaerolineae bacterium]